MINGKHGQGTYTVPKWVLINRPKIPQMPQNLSAQIVCPSPKVWDFNEKRLHWASVVRILNHHYWAVAIGQTPQWGRIPYQIEMKISMPCTLTRLFFYFSFLNLANISSSHKFFNRDFKKTWPQFFSRNTSSHAKASTMY